MNDTHIIALSRFAAQDAHERRLQYLHDMVVWRQEQLDHCRRNVISYGRVLGEQHTAVAQVLRLLEDAKRALDEFKNRVDEEHNQ